MPAGLLNSWQTVVPFARSAIDAGSSSALNCTICLFPSELPYADGSEIRCENRMIAIGLKLRQQRHIAYPKILDLVHFLYGQNSLLDSDTNHDPCTHICRRT